MGNFNKVILLGNLTRDIELRYTPSNQPVANIGLAVNRRYKNREDQLVEETTFVDCEAWGRTAESMSQYLSKGKPVFLEGRLKYDSWEDQQGQKRNKLKVVIESFQFVDSRTGGGGGGSTTTRTVEMVAGPNSGDGGPHQPISEDDIPF